MTERNVLFRCDICKGSTRSQIEDGSLEDMILVCVSSKIFLSIMYLLKVQNLISNFYNTI